MRKILIALLTLCSFTAQAREADTIRIDGVTYKIDPPSVAVIEVSKELTSLDLPKWIPYGNGEYLVNEIWDDAAKDCTNLTSITLNSEILYIGDCAFKGTGIKSVNFPTGVIQIGSEAFSNCPDLKVVIFEEAENNDVVIGRRCFSRCESLEYFSCSRPILSLGDGALSDCTKLFAVKLGDVEHSYDKIFNNCFNLRSFYANKIDIGNSMFSKCANLTSVEIRSNGSRIGNSAFDGCHNLQKFDFRSTESLKIEDACFRSCTSLKEVNLHVPEITRIGNGAFLNCRSLTELPTGIDGITSIGSLAFQGCEELKSIIIPESVTEIGNMAFSNCSSLENVTVLWDNPIEINEDVFDMIHDPAWLHIPSGTRDSYSVATGWSNFTILEGASVADAVSEVSQNPTVGSPTYNLNGVRSSDKGILIKNGKKFINN